MRDHSGLLTDLYELTMAAGYMQTRFRARATFELFVRRLPPHRNFLIAAGLDQAIEFLENVRFIPEEIRYLRDQPVFHKIGDEFFDYLNTFRFSGDVWAMPEGTVVFPDEPMLRVTAPIIEAQIMETFLLATLSYQTMIASKAARVVTAARGRAVVEFGARRAHGSQASLLAARAAAIGGCVGTSNVLAGQQFDMQTYGTQAHSWIMAHENEEAAFRSFLDTFPNDAVLLLDTYNIRRATKTILSIGKKPAGVRLDSGDLAKDSRWVRRELDRAGWKSVKIFASGDLDENRISQLLADGAALDAFGVGTALATPGDAPHLNLIYKLVEVQRGKEIRGAAKLNRTKTTYPGRKQVFRHLDRRGNFVRDRIALEDESANGGEPLLIPVVRDGKRINAPEALRTLRERCAENIARLPKRYLDLKHEVRYPVRYSKNLQTLLKEVRERVKKK